jgi:hypothetical protein
MGYRKEYSARRGPQVHRLTDSAAGIALLALTILLGLGGLIADLIDQSDPPTLFGAAAVCGIATIGAALDEHRRRGTQGSRWVEALFGRALIALALVLEVVAVALGLQGSPYRNLWLVLAIVVALDGLAVIVDTDRLVLAREGTVETRPFTDALPGALAGGIALGLAIIGFLAGLFSNPHAPAWLYAGVICALISNAFMLDEHLYVATHLRGSSGGKRRPAPFKR